MESQLQASGSNPGYLEIPVSQVQILPGSLFNKEIQENLYKIFLFLYAGFLFFFL